MFLDLLIKVNFAQVKFGIGDVVILIQFVHIVVPTLDYDDICLIFDIQNEGIFPFLVKILVLGDTGDKFFVLVL